MIRPLLFILFCTLISFSQAQDLLQGGVDVGNGRVINFEFEMSEMFNTEQELVDYVDRNKESIGNGSYSDIAVIIKDLKCSNKIKFKHLAIKKSYPFVNGFLLTQKFNGHMKIELTDCKTGIY